MKLVNQTKIRLNEISKIENYFNSEINQRKSFSEKLSKYVAAFNFIDKLLIVFSTTTGGVCIVSHVAAVGALVGIAGAGLLLHFL